MLQNKMTLHQIFSIQQAQIQGKFQLSRGRRPLPLPRYVKEILINTRRRETLLTNQLSPSLKEGYDTFFKAPQRMDVVDGWIYATSFFIHIHDSHFAFSSIGITPAPKHKNTWNHVHIKLGSCGCSIYANASFIHIQDFHLAFSSIGIPPPLPPRTQNTSNHIHTYWILVVIACFIHIHVFSFAFSLIVISPPKTTKTWNHVHTKLVVVYYGWQFFACPWRNRLP